MGVLSPPRAASEGGANQTSKVGQIFLSKSPKTALISEIFPDISRLFLLEIFVPMPEKLAISSRWAHISAVMAPQLF
jgi:hypothetical protein